MNNGSLAMGYSSRLLGNPKYNSNPADYGVGDFNGDGVDDVIFAGPSWSNGTWDGVSWNPNFVEVDWSRAV